LCIGTIFYMPQHDAAFRKMHRVLRPGGLLILNCINRQLVTRYFGMELDDIDPKFTRSYTASELSDRLARHFAAIPEAFVQQPVTGQAGRFAAMRVWIAPLRWLFGRHPVSTAGADVIGMFNYFVVRKAT
jgi:SAM-dependent methyltransferase